MDPRKVGSAWEILAPAKLNLFLEVLGRRSDGFHELETLMLPVRIYDHLLWSPAAEKFSSANNGCSLQVQSLLPREEPSAESVPTGEENLVLRAAHLLAQRAGVQPRGTFRLFKRIPTQAGLGGGSSDAAATLKLANAAWGLGYSAAKLTELAAELGSDVPFFVSHGAAICRGRGECMEPVTRLPRLNFVVIKPTVGASTAEVFHAFAGQGAVEPEVARSSQKKIQCLVKQLQCGALADASGGMKNRLERVVAQKHKQVGQACRALKAAHCLGHFMTGSGSACVGVAPSARRARRMAGLLAGMNLGSVFATSSC